MRGKNPASGLQLSKVRDLTDTGGGVLPCVPQPGGRAEVNEDVWKSPAGIPETRAQCGLPAGDPVAAGREQRAGWDRPELERWSLPNM